MVYKKRLRHRKVRKTGKRKTFRRFKRRIPRTIGPPGHFTTKVKYSDIRQVSLAPTGYDLRYWRLNSLNDPDASGAGGQPLYHDQYSAMYGAYRVFGCKVNWKIAVSTSASSWYAPYVCMVPYMTAPGYTTIETAMQAPMAVWKMLLPGHTVASLTKYYRVSSICGVPGTAVRDEDNYAATVSSNPLSQCNLQVWIQNNDGSASFVTTQEMTLTYYVKYYNRILPNSS